MASKSKIIFLGALSDVDFLSISEFLNHDCKRDGEWAKFTRIDSNFEFAVCSDGNHFIRLPGTSKNGVRYGMKEVKTYNDTYGYVVVSGFTFMHRLVAQAFLPNFKPYPEKEVNHLDGDKSNNNVNNIELVTHRENIQHFFKDYRMSERRRIWDEKHCNRTWTPEQRERFRSNYHTVEWTQEMRDNMSKVHKGKKLSKEHVEILRNVNKGQKYNNGKIWVTNGINSIRICQDKLADMENKGYHRGRICNMPKYRKSYKHSAEFLEKQKGRTALKGDLKCYPV